MKMLVKAIERVNRSGTSKSGNAYSIDQTQITVEVPFDSVDGFGFKPMTYQFGTSANFASLEPLRGKLPAELEVELGTELNSYGSPQTVVVGIKTPPAPAKA